MELILKEGIKLVRADAGHFKKLYELFGFWLRAVGSLATEEELSRNTRGYYLKV